MKGYSPSNIETATSDKPSFSLELGMVKKCEKDCANCNCSKCSNGQCGCACENCNK